MILYDGTSWKDVILVYVGTVWPAIIKKFTIITGYAFMAYIVSCTYSVNFGSEGRTILLGTMSFLLIFRANQAYTRYWLGRCAVSNFFSDIREFLMLSMIFVRGGICTSSFLFNLEQKHKARFAFLEDQFDQKARQARLDLVRLCVALAVSLKLHSRICLEGYCFGSICKHSKWRVDWDRYRLRQLLAEEEWEVIDDCIGILDPETPEAEDALTHFQKQFGLNNECVNQEPPASWPEEFDVKKEGFVRPPVAICFLIREVLFRNMNEYNNNQPWGIKERFISGLTGLLAAMQHSFEEIDQIITTPLPLPYANLCKTLLLCFLLSMPFFVDYKLGLFANTAIPSLVSLALLGIDAIATELENPFGDDSNDLDILELLHVLECESMEILSLTGDDKGCSCFCWVPMPRFIRETSCRVLQNQLAVRIFMEEVEAKSSMAPQVEKQRLRSDGSRLFDLNG